MLEIIGLVLLVILLIGAFFAPKTKKKHHMEEWIESGIHSPNEWRFKD